MTLNLLPWRKARKNRMLIELLLAFFLPVVLVSGAGVYLYQNMLLQQNNWVLIEQDLNSQQDLLQAKLKQQNKVQVIACNQIKLMRLLIGFSKYLPKGCYLQTWQYASSGMNWFGVAQSVQQVQDLLSALNAANGLKHVQLVSIKNDQATHMQLFQIKADF